jgi:transcription elongation factor GreA-like protein
LCELYEFARCQFGMGFEEFGELTPDMFWGFYKQRHNNFKYQQYCAGIVASAIYAANGVQDIDPMDFVSKTADEMMYDFKVNKLIALRDAIGNAFTDKDALAAKLKQARKDALVDLTSEGIPNAQQIVADVFD